MIDRVICRAVLLGLALAVPARAAPERAAVFALPDGTAKVSATLDVRPPPMTGLPRDRILDVAMTKLGDAKPITRYDVELSKRLHLIAISADLRTFLHEHAERPDATGHFRVAMHFPHDGLWRVYADAVPTGLGQQVMRFDVDVATAGSPAAAVPALQPRGSTGHDGRYAVRFDQLELRAGQEANLSLHILRDSRPAPDLTPYLGVAAHAVLIAADDLSYIHVHAGPASSPPGGGAGMAHGMSDMDMPHSSGAPNRKVAPDLSLHVLAPKAGPYVLWIQFMAGGQVRTVRFVVAVA